MLKRCYDAVAVFFLLLFSCAVYAGTEENETIFNWAESEYSQYFSPSGQTTLSLDPWSYRYYPDTGTYLGINSSDEVYVLGGPFGQAPLPVGVVDDFIALINSHNGGDESDNDDGNNGGDNGGDNGGNSGTGACVTLPFPATGTTTTHIANDAQSGAAGTITTRYDLATGTQAITVTESSFSVSGFTTTSTTTTTQNYRIEDGYLYESSIVTDVVTATGFGSFTDTITTEFNPEYMTGAAVDFCEGQTWTTSEVQQTISSSSAPDVTSTTSPEEGLVESVGTSVTVPAGTFNTVLIKKTQTDGSISRIWISRQHGVFVKQESVDSSGNTTTLIEIESIN